MQAGEIFYGTSSWSAKGWVGPFYPPGTKTADFLTYYSTQFSTVECDATYYRVPAPRLVSGWANKVPSGFKLAAKFPRSIVHGGEGPRPDPAVVLSPEHTKRDLEHFLESMELLGDKCGPLLIQFPYFNRQAFRGIDEFLARLGPFFGSLPPTFRYAVEVRNRHWVGEPLLELLAHQRVAFALVEHAYMPHPSDLAEELELVTTDFLYCRLIGDRKKVEARTKVFDQLVLDQSAGLERWSGLLSAVRERVPESYVYANNHYAGHGPATIRRVEELVAALPG